MTGLVLSIIMILGLAGGPSDFSDSCTIENSQTVSQSVE